MVEEVEHLRAELAKSQELVETGRRLVHQSNEGRLAEQKLIDTLKNTILEMDRLHQLCFEVSCTCYSIPDDCCAFCNRSSRLSELAAKVLTD